MEQNQTIILFEEKKVRRVWHNEEWYFVITDVIQVLTDSTNPKQYFNNLKRRDPELFKGGVQIEHTLAVDTEGGKQRMNCANRQSLFRLIMSIPSPKAEPFKLWLAQVGEERLQEIENPEIGIERIREIYKAKGYPDDWIENRIKSIEIRQALTDEWKGRGVKEGSEYSILTAEISKATFGMTPSDYKKHKNLDTQNLRDHMTPFELIFTMLGEASAREYSVNDDAKGFDENRESAYKGGRAAGNALNAYEQSTGKKVVTKENYLNQIKEAETSNELPNGDDTEGEQ